MRLKIIMSLALMGLMASCAQVMESKSDFKLYVFDCGTIGVSDISVFSPYRCL